MESCFTVFLLIPSSPLRLGSDFEVLVELAPRESDAKFVKTDRNEHLQMSEIEIREY